MQRRLVQKFTFILEWGQGLVYWRSTHCTGHIPGIFPLHAAYSALRHFFLTLRSGKGSNQKKISGIFSGIFCLNASLSPITTLSPWLTEICGKIVKTQRNSTQLNSTQSNSKSNFVGLDIVPTCSPTPPTTTTTNFSGTSRPARELKFGTDTH